jgi:hypothetical protein
MLLPQCICTGYVRVYHWVGMGLRAVGGRTFESELLQQCDGSEWRA